MGSRLDIYSLLEDILGGATACISTPFCSVVWPGCDFPDGLCSDGVFVGVSGDIVPLVTNCSSIAYIDVTVVVSLCNNAVDSAYTMGEATLASKEFYSTLYEVYSGLLAWWETVDGCTKVIPDGFRCSPSNGNSDCSRFYSTWRVKL